MECIPVHDISVNIRKLQFAILCHIMSKKTVLIQKFVFMLHIDNIILFS